MSTGRGGWSGYQFHERLRIAPNDEIAVMLRDAETAPGRCAAVEILCRFENGRLLATPYVRTAMTLTTNGPQMRWKMLMGLAEKDTGLPERDLCVLDVVLHLATGFGRALHRIVDQPEVADLVLEQVRAVLGR